MKLFIAGFSFLFSLALKAQEPSLPLKEAQIVYESVDTSVSGTAAQLKGRAKAWVAKSFNDGKTVIQLDDNENGKLLINGSMRISKNIVAAPIERLSFTVDFSFKDNKYRIRIFNLEGNPIGLESLRTSVEDLYKKYKSNDYPFSNKKQEKYMQEAKERDRLTLIEVDENVNLVKSMIKTALSTSDDF
jgi:hypothetical protein